MKKVVVFLSLFGLLGCAPTKITKTWVAEDIVTKKYKKVLILSVLPDSDKELGSNIENHLADDLREMGFLALAANKIFSPGTFVKGDTLRAKSAIEGKGFDAVLTVVLLDKKKELYHIPGKITDYSNINRFSQFERYYNIVAENIYSPSYFGEETKYIWENNFYDLTTRERIYSARTRSFDFTSKNTLAHTYGMLMAQSLIEKKILQKPEYMNE